MSDQLNHMSGQFCSCSDILSEHFLLLIGNPANVTTIIMQHTLIRLMCLFIRCYAHTHIQYITIHLETHLERCPHNVILLNRFKCNTCTHNTQLKVAKKINLNLCIALYLNTVIIILTSLLLLHEITIDQSVSTMLAATLAWSSLKLIVYMMHLSDVYMYSIRPR